MRNVGALYDLRRRLSMLTPMAVGLPLLRCLSLVLLILRRRLLGVTDRSVYRHSILLMNKGACGGVVDGVWRVGIHSAGWVMMCRGWSLGLSGLSSVRILLCSQAS